MSRKFAEYKGLNLSEVNKEVLKEWDEKDVFHKSMTTREGRPTFVFYEGETWMPVYNRDIFMYEIIDTISMAVDEDLSRDSFEFSVYPNPFNGSCQISEQIDYNYIDIYDNCGQKVDRVYDKFWHPSQDLSSGIYFVIPSGSEKSFSKGKKIVYMK